MPDSEVYKRLLAEQKAGIVREPPNKELKDRAAQIQAEVGCTSWRSMIIAKREAGLVPDRKGANGAKSNYTTFDADAEQFEMTPEQASAPQRVRSEDEGPRLNIWNFINDVVVPGFLIVLFVCGAFLADLRDALGS